MVCILVPSNNLRLSATESEEQLNCIVFDGVVMVVNLYHDVVHAN